LSAKAEGENQAPDHVLVDLRRLPSDVRFGTVYEVWAALGGTVETVHGAKVLLERRTAPGSRGRERRRRGRLRLGEITAVRVTTWRRRRRVNWYAPSRTPAAI